VGMPPQDHPLLPCYRYRTVTVAHPRSGRGFLLIGSQSAIIVSVYRSTRPIHGGVRALAGVLKWAVTTTDQRSPSNRVRERKAYSPAVWLWFDWRFLGRHLLAGGGPLSIFF